MGFASFSPAGWDERGQHCPQHHPERCPQHGPQQHAQNPHQHPLGKVRGGGTACKCQLYFLANPNISTKSFLFPPPSLWLVACKELYEIFSKESHHREGGEGICRAGEQLCPAAGRNGEHSCHAVLGDARAWFSFLPYLVAFWELVGVSQHGEFSLRNKSPVFLQPLSSTNPRGRKRIITQETQKKNKTK